jgi:L-ribulose-5-phosphate 3-epimerase UlaE
MSALGVAMLKAFGWDELDEESVKRKLDEMAEGAELMKEAATAMCAELGDQECLGKIHQTDGMIEQARQDGYRAASDLGNLQSQEYEEPEYKDEQGEVELYFEPTPSPERLTP